MALSNKQKEKISIEVKKCYRLLKEKSETAKNGSKDKKQNH